MANHRPFNPVALCYHTGDTTMTDQKTPATVLADTLANVLVLDQHQELALRDALADLTDSICAKARKAAEEQFSALSDDLLNKAEVMAEDAVGDAIDEVNIEQQVERAIDEADWDTKAEEAIEEIIEDMAADAVKVALEDMAADAVKVALDEQEPDVTALAMAAAKHYLHHMTFTQRLRWLLTGRSH